MPTRRALHDRPLCTLMLDIAAEFVDAGFAVQRVIDWRPSPEQIAAQPHLAEEVDRPMFLIIAAGR